MAEYKYDESYIGKKYNYLRVIGFDYNEFDNRCFNCKCDCGREYFKRDICSEYGISVEMFDYRVKHKGMGVMEALTTPKMSIGRPRIIS